MGAVKSMNLITNDRKNIEVSIAFSESKAKVINEKIKDELTKPEILNDIMGKTDKCTLIKIRSFINKNGIGQDEFIDILNKHNVIDRITDYLHNNELMGWGYRRRLLKPNYYDFSCLRLAQICSMSFGEISDIKFVYQSNKLVKGTATLYFDEIEGYPGEIKSYENVDKERFKDYQFSFSSRVSQKLPIDFSAVRDTVEQIIVNYFYNKVGLVKSIYNENLFQVNQIKSLINSGEADKIFNTEIIDAKARNNDPCDDKNSHDNNNIRDEQERDYLFKNSFELKFDMQCNAVIIKSNNFTEENYLCQLKQYSRILNEIAQFSMSSLDALQNFPYFCNDDNIIEAAEDGCSALEELSDAIANYE